MERVLDIMTYTRDACDSVVKGFIVKCLIATGVLSVEFALSGVENYVTIAVFFLVVVYFISAILVEWYTGNEITSRKASKTAVKVVVYALMIATGSFSELVIGAAIELPIAEIITSFIAVTEAISILENFGKAGFVIPKRLLRSLKEFRDKK